MNKIELKVLETERLILRRIENSDAKALENSDAKALYDNIYNNFEWHKYYSQIPFDSFKKFQILIAKYQEWYAKKENFRWGIVTKSENEIIGIVQNIPDILNESSKLACILSYNHTGGGYAKEAVQRLIDYNFDELNFHRVEAESVVNNLNSIKLIESLGMTYESTKRESYKLGDQYYDQKLYSLIKK